MAIEEAIKLCEEGSKGMDRLNSHTKQCTECGFVLPQYSKFCIDCGAFIEDGDEDAVSD